MTLVQGRSLHFRGPGITKRTSRVKTGLLFVRLTTFGVSIYDRLGLYDKYLYIAHKGRRQYSRSIGRRVLHIFLANTFTVIGATSRIERGRKSYVDENCSFAYTCTNLTLRSRDKHLSRCFLDSFLGEKEFGNIPKSLNADNKVSMLPFRSCYFT